LRHASGNNVVCSEGQALQIHAAEALPQENRDLRHARLLRCDNPGQLPTVLAAELGSAVSHSCHLERGHSLSERKVWRS
jgi:hypothetical protein